MKLNEKQLAFCREYTVDFNATQAAIRAGYTVRSAGQIGERLLKKDEIGHQIKLLLEKTSERLEISKDRVLQELAAIGYSNVVDFIDDDNKVKSLKDIPRILTKAISGIEVTETTETNMATGKSTTEINTKLKFHPKTAALDSLSKHLGLFEKDNNQKAKLKITVTNKKPVVDGD